MGSPLIVQVAAAEPVPTSAAIVFVTTCVFAALASGRRGRSVGPLPLSVFGFLIAIWLSRAVEIWGEEDPEMIGGRRAWGFHGWRWTAHLVFAVGGVVILGMALRALGARRDRLGWVLIACAAGCFGAWVSAVPHSAIVAVVTLAIVAATLVAVRSHKPSSPETETSKGGMRSLAVIAVATVLPFWLLISLLWLGLKEGENVVCHCWADNPSAWQYSVQFIVALAGAAAWIAAVAAYVNSRRAPAAWLVLLAAGVTALWFVFPATG